MTPHLGRSSITFAGRKPCDQPEHHRPHAARGGRRDRVVFDAHRL